MGKSTTPAVDTATNPPAVLQLADAKAMSQSDRIAMFKEKDAGASKLTIELAKLLVAIRSDMKDPSKATPLLKKSGIRPGTVNTASENARVFTMLVPNLIGEAEFDTFTSAQMRSINKVSSGAGKKRMTAEEVADFIKKNPADFGEEFDSLHLTGMTIAECEQEQRDLLARKQKQEQEEKERLESERVQKEKDAADAIAQAQADKEAAEAKQRDAEAETERLRLEAANRPPETPAEPVTPAEPTGEVHTETPPANPEPVASESTEPPVLNEGEHKSLDAIAPTPPPAAEQPRVIVPMTPAVEESATTEAKLKAAGSIIEHLGRIMDSLPDADRATLAAQLSEFAAKYAPATGRANVVSGKPGARKRA